MKKVFNLVLAASLCFLASFIHAEANEKSIGGGLVFGSKSDGFEGSALGIDLRGVFGINDKFRIGADFDFYFAEENVTLWAIDGNVHYVFVEDEVLVYGLAGLAILHVSFDGTLFGIPVEINETDIGLNLGGGVDVPTKFGAVFGELKIQIEDVAQVVIAGGVRFDI